MLEVKTVDRETLAFQIHSRPFTSAIDVSEVPVKDVIPIVRGALDDAVLVAPEDAALNFYLRNHAVAEIIKRNSPDDPLRDEYCKLLDDYHYNGTLLAERMFCYLLCICFRESRHIHNIKDFYSDPEVHMGVYTAISEVVGTNSTGVIDYFKEWYGTNVTLGDLTRTMLYLFYNGDWATSFGGEAWADVCRVLDRFVHGEISAEIMLDTAFTLAHNNGPIYNKGLFFKMYGDKFVRILDVQRAGMIPEFVHDNDDPHISDSMREYRERASDILGGFGDGHVDWFLATSLGAVNSYEYEKEQQIIKHGPSEFSEKEKLLIAQKKAEEKAAKEAAAKAKAEADEKKAKQLEEYKKTHWQLSENEWVEKVAVPR